MGAIAHLSEPSLEHLFWGLPGDDQAKEGCEQSLCIQGHMDSVLKGMRNQLVVQEELVPFRKAQSEEGYRRLL